MGTTTLHGTANKTPEFTGIRGIGKARAAALRQLGVVSIRRLADQDPEILADRLRDLHEQGVTPTNLEPMAAEWVAAAQDAIAQAGSWTEELGSFTVRFEAQVEASEDTEHRDYVCLVYDEKGAGQEASFGVDPAYWAPYIVDRAGLSDAVRELVEHQSVHVVVGEAQDSGCLPMEVHAHGLDHGEAIVVLVQDSGNTLQKVSAPLEADGVARFSVAPMTTGEYRVFAWVEGETEDHQYVKPSCGPLIRVRI